MYVLGKGMGRGRVEERREGKRIHYFSNICITEYIQDYIAFNMSVMRNKFRNATFPTFSGFLTFE